MYLLHLALSVARCGWVTGVASWSADSPWQSRWAQDDDDDDHDNLDWLSHKALVWYGSWVRYEWRVPEHVPSLSSSCYSFLVLQKRIRTRCNLKKRNLKGDNKVYIMIYFLNKRDKQWHVQQSFYIRLLFRIKLNGSVTLHTNKWIRYLLWLRFEAKLGLVQNLVNRKFEEFYFAVIHSGSRFTIHTEVTLCRTATLKHFLRHEQNQRDLKDGKIV